MMRLYEGPKGTLPYFPVLQMKRFFIFRLKNQAGNPKWKLEESGFRP